MSGCEKGEEEWEKKEEVWEKEVGGRNEKVIEEGKGRVGERRRECEKGEKGWEKRERVWEGTRYTPVQPCKSNFQIHT